MPPKRRTPAPSAAEPEREPERASKRSKVAKEPEKAPAKAGAKPSTKKATAAQTASKAVAAKKEVAKKAAPKAAPKAKVAKTPAEKKQTTRAKSVAPDLEESIEKIATNYITPNYKPLKDLPVINEIQHTKPLTVFVCGEGANGELGLGNAKGQMDVKRPRLNKFLESMKVVHVAAGGMHLVALTADNKILTWGVNDEGALGRDTKWDAPTKDIDDADDSDSDSDASTTGLNPVEATPTEIPSDRFHPGVKFVDIIAGDSCSFALTDQGRVYGWGTFKSNEGTLGFTPQIKVARQPILLEHLKHITKIACGSNHVLVVDKKGVLSGFGAGQQHQLARQIIKRSEVNATVPNHIPIKDGRKAVKVKAIACGSFHSFAIGENDKVYSWGLNNYAQCGIADDIGSEEGSVVKVPTQIEDLKPVSMIEGGGQHSIAVAKDGDILVWGRCDGYQTGLDLSTVPRDNLIFPAVEEGAPEPPVRLAKVLKYPTKVTGVQGKGVFAATGHDHCIAINAAGRAYSWGFSATYQTGQGTFDDVETATLIDNTATRDRKLVWAGAGGQYSAFAAYQDDKPMTNGTS